MSSLGARATSVSPGTSWPRMWSRNAARAPSAAAGRRSGRRRRTAPRRRRGRGRRAPRARPPPSATARHGRPQPGRLPHRPQHRLGASPRAPSAARRRALVADRAGGLDTGGDRAGHPSRRRGLGAHVGQEVGVDEASASSSSLVPAAAAVELLAAQRPPQPAQRRPRRHRRSARARRRRRSRGRSASARPAPTAARRRAATAAGGPPSRRAPGTSLAGTATGTPDDMQDPAQRAGAPLPAHDHRHLRPRHAVEQVRLAQLGRDAAPPPGTSRAAGATSTRPPAPAGGRLAVPRRTSRADPRVRPGG